MYGAVWTASLKEMWADQKISIRAMARRLMCNHQFIIDKGLPAWDAIKASFDLVNRNVGTVIVLFLASILAFFIGAILCGIGLLVTIPVTIIATAYAYRMMTGQSVAP